MLPHKGKVALVTGGAKRIGKDICEHLIREGWQIIVHYHQSAIEAENFASNNPSVICIEQCDFSNPKNIQPFISNLYSRYGKIDLLVNCASSFINDSLDNMSLSTWEANLSTNGLAPLLLTKYFAEQQGLDQNNQGRVINLLDNTLKPRGDIFTSYSLSNKMLKHITKLTAKHYAPYILINGISLGTTLKGTNQSDKHFNQMVESCLLKKAVTMDDLLALISFLLKSNSMTGQILKLSSEQSS